MRNVRQLVADFGWPRIIIFLFLVALFVGAPFVRVRIDASIADVLNRFGQNGLFVLAMVPDDPVRLRAELRPVHRHHRGPARRHPVDAVRPAPASWASSAPSPWPLPSPSLFGWLYGKLLNKVKGEEMTIAMYVGFAGVMFMCIMWLVLPYTSPTMVWGYAGKGLRTHHHGRGLLAAHPQRLPRRPHRRSSSSSRPGCCSSWPCCAGLIWLFMRTKTGTAMTAVGSNPDLRPRRGHQRRPDARPSP